MPKKNSLLAESKEIKSVDLFITERCNLACTYCFHQQSPATLTSMMGKAIIDKLHEINDKEMLITFFGGEPLLYPELVLELALYARTLWAPRKLQDGSLEQTVRFNISTNGTYFNEEMFRKYRDLGFRMQISIDGDQETTEMNRRGIDFIRVVENIKNILEIFPDAGVRMTFTPDTVGRLAINIMYLHQLGFNKIMHHAVMEANWTPESVEQYSYQLKQVYHYRRYVKKNGSKLDINFIDSPLRVLNDEKATDSNYCEAGKTYLGILPNGDVYPCHRAASAKKFKLGNILDDSMPIIRGMFLSLDKVSTGCSAKCPAARTCHTCVFTHYIVNNSLAKPIDKYCRICHVEHSMAETYLQTELNDKHERKLELIGNVLADLSEQYIEVQEDILKLSLLVGNQEETKCSHPVTP
jgi:uncharacterized protein